MSGYRDTSSFDPNAGGDHGPPLRPFNNWQWLGVGFGVVGALVIAAQLASRTGWLGVKLDDTVPAGTSLLLLGSVLVNSRRQPGQPLSAETRRQRTLIILAALAIGVVVAALVIYFKGA